MYIDTHCHLDSKDIFPDLDKIIKNSRKLDVKFLITMGVDVKSSNKCMDIAEKYDCVYFAAGIHPEELIVDPGFLIEACAEEIKRLSKNSKCVAIGEIGLDYNCLDKEGYTGNRYEKEKDMQKRLFVKMLEVAAIENLPVVVHCRDADSEVYEILKGFANLGVRGVMHSYTGTEEYLNKFLKLGFYISYNGIITFKNAADVRKLCEYTPVDRILLETDSPYLAPEPHRGKVCLPQYIVEVYKKVLSIKNMSLGEIEKFVKRNSFSLFSRLKK